MPSDAAVRGRLEQAKATLDRLTVRAPIAGEILQSKYRVGEYETPAGEALIVLGNTTKLTARMDVDERDVGKVTVIVRADAFHGKDFIGTVRELGRHMGRKNVRTDDPAQRNDTKIRSRSVARRLASTWSRSVVSPWSAANDVVCVRGPD